MLTKAILLTKAELARFIATFVKSMYTVTDKSKAASNGLIIVQTHYVITDMPQATNNRLIFVQTLP